MQGTAGNKNCKSKHCHIDTISNSKINIESGGSGLLPGLILSVCKKCYG